MYRAKNNVKRTKNRKNEKNIYLGKISIWYTEKCTKNSAANEITNRILKVTLSVCLFVLVQRVNYICSDFIMVEQ